MNIILFEAEEIGKPLLLTDERAMHIINTLKFKQGDMFDAGIVNSVTGKAIIQKIDTSSIHYTFSPENRPIKRNPVSLLTAVTRPGEAKKILQNCSTIGISALYLAVFDKTEKSYIESSLWKESNYRKYFIQGACQAFSSDIPDLFLYSSLDKCLEKLPMEYTVRAALDNYEAEESLWNIESSFTAGAGEKTLLSGLPPYAILAAGGERGWSARERNLLRDYGFKLYSIGKRVLKTETACIAGLTVLLGKTGCFQD